jgi:uncharacterized protein YbaR (Trm112 family)
MHIVLTDILTCPRCGPAFGLILLAHRIENRRVLDGVLGCANCREQYPVAGGAGHFGAEPRLPDPARSTEQGADGSASAMRLGALLGVTEGPAFVLLAGPSAAVAPALATLIEALEVVVVSGVGTSGGGASAAERPPPHGPATDPTPGVTLLGVAGAALPLASGKLAAVGLSGEAADVLLEEGVRVLSPVGRLVLEDAPADAEERLRAQGLRALAREADTIVAVRG